MTYEERTERLEDIIQDIIDRRLSWNLSNIEATPAKIIKTSLPYTDMEEWVEWVKTTYYSKPKESQRYEESFIQWLEENEHELIAPPMSEFIDRVISVFDRYFPRLKYLRNNYQMLINNNLLQHICDFDSDFRGRIIIIHNFEDIRVIETTKGSYNPDIPMGSSYSFATPKEALIYGLVGDNYYSAVQALWTNFEKEQ